MSRKRHRGGLSRLGKSAEDIFKKMEPENNRANVQEGGSLLEDAPLVAVGLWWQGIYLRQCQLATTVATAPLRVWL